jgi:hypothetical protein
MGQVYQCWWRICREINVFLQVRISHVLRCMSICDLFTDSPMYFAKKLGSMILQHHQYYQCMKPNFSFLICLLRIII